jgi:TRAP-type C4-dicarboxylate transport system permease large subunit
MAMGMNTATLKAVCNLCIGLCTPPVGTVLFIGCGIAKLSIGEIVRPLLAFFAAMLVALLFVSYLPATSTWLPSALGLLG